MKRAEMEGSRKIRSLKHRLLKAITPLTAFGLVRSCFGLFGLVYFHTSSMSYLFGLESAFQVPLFDFFLLKSKTFLTVVALLHVSSLVAFIAGYRVDLTGSVAAGSKFIILFSHLDRVLAFSYFLPIGWLAFAYVEIARRRRAWQSADMILPMFLSSVFLTSALQKVFRIDDMKLKLPLELNKYLRNDFAALCDGINCLLQDWTMLALVSIELAIGLLILSRRNRILGVAANLAFCVFLYSFVAMRFIGVILLTIHLAIVFQKNRETVIELVHSMRLKWSAILLSIPLCLYLALAAFNGHAVGAIREFAFSALCFFPFFAIVMHNGLRRTFEESFPSMGRFGLALLASYALVLVSFGLLPQIDNYQKTQMIGWSMFSGANARNPIFLFSAQSNTCPEPPDFAPLIFRDDNEYRSFSLDLLSRYRQAYIEVCPELTVSPIRRRPSIYESSRL